jgi:biotin carboxylase
MVTFLDANMALFAEAAVLLGLVFHSPDTARALTDKALQRQRLREAGLANPACEVIAPGATDDEVSEAVSAVGWPAILKPRSAQGSRYTFLANDRVQLDRLLNSLASDRPEMILEGFIRDDPAMTKGPYASYVSVESVAANGVINHLALTGRFAQAENFRETGFFIPAAIEEPVQSAVLAVAGQAIEALGVTSGCLHTEVKLSPDGPRIIEVNGRVGGGVPEMLDRASGVDLLGLIFAVALGDEVTVTGPLPTRRVGYRFFLQPPDVSATVASIDGLDSVSDFPGVGSITIHQGPGADLDWKDGSRNHIVAVVGTAHDYDELLEVNRLLHEEVTVTYADVSRA